MEELYTTRPFKDHEGCFWHETIDGYHFESVDGINFGTIVVGGKTLRKNYRVVKDKNYEEIINNITNTDNNNG